MQEFVESLKETYTERQLSCEEQWPPVSVEKLVQLQLVEADKREGFRAGLPQHGASDDKVKRTPILHGDLFKVEEGKKPVRKLIVEGNAGIGKTTLCTLLTEEWAKGKIFTQFDCVLLLPLRDKLVSSASCLPDLLPLYHPDETVCGSVVQQLKRTRGKGVLIIADGWDELSEEKRSKISFIYNLLFGRLLPAAGVLLTSRPSASAGLHNLPTVDRLVEVVGFNEENVKQYVESEFEKCPEKASSLIEQLENNPVIQSVCSVPLNCAIICYLWYTLESGLPTTLTELYAHIVLNIILRNTKKTNPITGLLGLESFDDIPAANQEMFWLTCTFAYNCLSEDQLVFTENKVASTLPQVLDSSDKFLCLGLLQCARSLLPVGQGLSFHFVHLTIQEFLAALHLVTLPNEEKLKVCIAHARSDRFIMVWRFVFGLGCKKERRYSRKVVCLNDEVVDQFFTYIIHKAQMNRSLMLCHCSMESSDDSVCSKSANQINGKFEGYFGSIAHNSEDCIAVFHVLRRTLVCSGLILRLSHCGLNDKLLKNLTDTLSSAGRNLQVKVLSIQGNMLTDKGIADLFCRASASLSSLRSLSISFTQSSSCIANIIPRLTFFRSLTSFSVSDSPLGVSGIQCLEVAIQAGTFVKLERLSLPNTLTDDADINGALLATLLPSIVSHCLSLRKLKLHKNNLGVPGAGAVSELISSSRNQLELDLSDTNISAKAVAALFPPSRHSEPYCLGYLNLDENSIGYVGLIAIFRMLRSRTCLFNTKLDLSHIDLTTSVTAESQDQYHNILLPNTTNVFNLGSSFESRLTDLNLSDNNFNGNKVFILAECMLMCMSLRHLTCRNCSLTSSEVTALLDHLKHSGVSHKSLEWWDLSNNSIDDEGVKALFKSILKVKLFPSLLTVYLNGNPVSDKVEKGLKKTLSFLSSWVSMRQNFCCIASHSFPANSLRSAIHLVSGHTSCKVDATR